MVICSDVQNHYTFSSCLFSFLSPLLFLPGSAGSLEVPHPYTSIWYGRPRPCIELLSTRMLPGVGYCVIKCCLCGSILLLEPWCDNSWTSIRPHYASLKSYGQMDLTLLCQQKWFSPPFLTSLLWPLGISVPIHWKLFSQHPSQSTSLISVQVLGLRVLSLVDRISRLQCRYTEPHSSTTMETSLIRSKTAFFSLTPKPLKHFAGALIKAWQT